MGDADRGTRRPTDHGHKYCFEGHQHGGSLHPNAVHRRRHRKEKRHKLRAQLAAAPVAGRAAIEAKLQKTYALGFGMPPSKPAAPDAPAVPSLKADAPPAAVS